MKLKKLICIVMISVLGVLSFAGCAKKQDEKKTETSSEASTQEASAQVFAMDTYMNLKAYGKNAQKAVDDAKSEIERLDQLWSAVDKNSEIYQLNQKKKMKISDETLELIEFAKKKSKHHIIDPATGKPSEKDLKSVTIISKNGTLSDTLSTTLFVMGKDKAISYWKEHSKEFNMILVDENNKVYISQGIKDHFSSDSDFTVIKK